MSRRGISVTVFVSEVDPTPPLSHCVPTPAVVVNSSMQRAAPAPVMGQAIARASVSQVSLPIQLANHRRRRASVSANPPRRDAHAPKRRREHKYNDASDTTGASETDETDDGNVTDSENLEYKDALHNSDNEEDETADERPEEVVTRTHLLLFQYENHMLRFTAKYTRSKRELCVVWIDVLNLAK